MWSKWEHHLLEALKLIKRLFNGLEREPYMKTKNGK